MGNIVFRTVAAAAVVVIGLHNQITFADSEPLQTNLNGLQLVIDRDTGGILRMSYDPVGVMLEAASDQSSIVDVGAPVEGFEPQRLASRFSSGAKVSETGGEVLITIEKLGLSRPSHPIDGSVKAVVRLTADPDGKSVVMTCEVTNNSNAIVRQVAFPDLMGIRPFAGKEDTKFRTARSVMGPFEEMDQNNSPHGAGFYAQSSRERMVTSGSILYTTPMVMRWMDIGSRDGGFSLFQRRWTFEPKIDSNAEETRETVLLRRNETGDRALRLMCLHKVEIAQGQTWKSRPYVLTPHHHGWAEGIKPFRAWVKSNFDRDRRHPLPAHIRDGLGFRTVWMAEQYSDTDAESVVWKIDDLPRIAKDCKEHGIHEMVLWGWCPSFQLPIKAPYKTLGTAEQLAAAIQECKQLGVNVSLFLSMMSVADPSAKRYEWSVPKSGGWTYHREFYPMWQAEYGLGTNMRNAWADQSNPDWQRDVLDTVKFFTDLGCGSFGWDQFAGEPKSDSNLYTLSEKILDITKSHDASNTFNGENATDIEAESAYLDYSWNWDSYGPGGGYQVVASVLPAPRLNMNVEKSPRDVKVIFMDNLFLNLLPRAPDGIGGSQLIGDAPELSRAVKQCAARRAQFLSYFVDGTQVGTCILAKPSPPDSHVSSYIAPNGENALIVAINLSSQPRELEFAFDLEHWVPSAEGGYVIKVINEDGTASDTIKAQDGNWRFKTPALDQYELLFFEVGPDTRPAE